MTVAANIRKKISTPTFKSLISNTTSSTVESRPAAAVSIADARHWIASVLSPPDDSIHPLSVVEDDMIYKLLLRPRVRNMYLLLSCCCSCLVVCNVLCIGEPSFYCY